MNKDRAIQVIWNYMLLKHPLKKADVIFVLGNRDTRIAQYASKLFKEGWAPLLLFSGSGSVHNHLPGREQFVNSTEAEVFAEIAKAEGVPSGSILIENESQNTGQNYEFAIDLLRTHGVEPKIVIAVQKPYMERRTYATGKIWWPDLELIVTSPPIALADYPNTSNQNEQWVHGMVGDLQRIMEYPKKGFQIPQDIPTTVKEAFTYLVDLGYTDKLIKD
jgi:uncharacterized SAM-binding protein YcdF (DUF218 family)